MEVGTTYRIRLYAGSGTGLPRTTSGSGHDHLYCLGGLAWPILPVEVIYTQYTQMVTHLFVQKIILQINPLWNAYSVCLYSPNVNQSNKDIIDILQHVEHVERLLFRLSMIQDLFYSVNS